MATVTDGIDEQARSFEPALQREIAFLREQLRSLESRWVLPTVSSSAVVLLNRIACFTEATFGNRVTIHSMSEPDDPLDMWLVFHVDYSGDDTASRPLERKWYDEVRKLAPDSTGEFRLWVTPQR